MNKREANKMAKIARDIRNLINRVDHITTTEDAAHHILHLKGYLMHASNAAEDAHSNMGPEGEE